jgi:hypothetical protein
MGAHLALADESAVWVAHRKHEGAAGLHALVDRWAPDDLRRREGAARRSRRSRAGGSRRHAGRHGCEELSCPEWCGVDARRPTLIEADVAALEMLAHTWLGPISNPSLTLPAMGTIKGFTNTRASETVMALRFDGRVVVVTGAGGMQSHIDRISFMTLRRLGPRLRAAVRVSWGRGRGELGRAPGCLVVPARCVRTQVNDLGTAMDGKGAGSSAADKVVAEIKAAGGEAAPYGACERRYALAPQAARSPTSTR